STSTVGLPRLSRISRAWISTMSVIRNVSQLVSKAGVLLAGAPARLNASQRPTRYDVQYEVATMTTTIAALARVASQPRMVTGHGATNRPMTLVRRAMCIVTTMIGTAITPFSTALQNRARIGSSAVKFMATPIAVASAMVA